MSQRIRIDRACVLVLTWLLSSCTESTAPPAAPPAVPRLPSGEAGAVLSRALDAAGGWDRWVAGRDVGYVNTLTLMDQFGNIASQSIGWYMAPLHQGMKARMDSIGISTEVQLGVDGGDTWIVRDGTPVSEPQRIELAHFNLVSNLFWFSLPFAVAEMPCTVTDLGETSGDEAIRWRRLKVVFQTPNPAIPGEWFVLYINTQTGLIDRVHARIRASFLRHEIYMGKWIDYRNYNGLKKERRREFYPADADGRIMGDMVAEQLVEHVQLNNGYAAETFLKPSRAAGAKPANESPRFVPHALLQRVAAPLGAW